MCLTYPYEKESLAWIMSLRKLGASHFRCYALLSHGETAQQHYASLRLTDCSATVRSERILSKTHALQHSTQLVALM